MMRYQIPIKRGIEEIEWKAAIEEHWLMVPLGSVMRRPDLNIYTYLREYHFPRWRDVHGLARRIKVERIGDDQFFGAGRRGNGT